MAKSRKVVREDAVTIAACTRQRSNRNLERLIGDRHGKQVDALALGSAISSGSDSVSNIMSDRGQWGRGPKHDPPPLDRE
jgi:hypothetical protein